MATLLNSISFVSNILFLPKYRTIYYDYIVKWCCLINCNLCVWLDIVSILALSMTNMEPCRNQGVCGSVWCINLRLKTILRNKFIFLSSMLLSQSQTWKKWVYDGMELARGCNQTCQVSQHFCESSEMVRDLEISWQCYTISRNLIELLFSATKHAFGVIPWGFRYESERC